MESATTELLVNEGIVTGEVGIALPPWSKASARRAALDVALRGPFHDVCVQHNVVLAAAPSSYAWPRPGKSVDGKLLYDVRGLIEGGRIVPSRPPAPGGLGASDEEPEPGSAD